MAIVDAGIYWVDWMFGSGKTLIMARYRDWETKKRK